VRVSASDWMEEGWDLSQTVAFARELVARGVDFVDASSGGLVPQQKITTGPGYQVPFSEAVRKEAGVATFAVGMITEAEQAKLIIAEGRADFVALGRSILFDPRWTWRAAAEMGETIDAPPSYWRGVPAAQSGLFKTQIRER